jgi:hypothetical protein
MRQQKGMVIGKQCAGGRCDTGRAWLLASSALAEGATIEECDYWQTVCWRKMRHWKGAVIGKRCTGGGCDNSSVWLLASSALAEDAAMTEVHDLLAASVTLKTSEPK